MRVLAAILALYVTLTQPNGMPVYVRPDQVAVVSATHDSYCVPNARTQIATLGGNVCVVESPAEVLRKLGADVKP